MNETPEIAADNQPQFLSLHYVEGFTIPEPITQIHGSLLWQAILLTSRARASTITEAQLANRTLSMLSERKGYGHRDTMRSTVIGALGDLEADKLLVPGDNYSRIMDGTSTYNFYTQKSSSRPIRMSKLGIQIAGESARRVLNDKTRNVSTRYSTTTIYGIAVRRLIAETNYINPIEPDLISLSK